MLTLPPSSHMTTQEDISKLLHYSVIFLFFSNQSIIVCMQLILLPMYNKNRSVSAFLNLQLKPNPLSSHPHTRYPEFFLQNHFAGP